MAAQEFQAPESVGRLQTRALFVGGIALLVSILGAVLKPGDFYQSYLMSFLLILGLTVGSLGLVMLQLSNERPLGHHHPPSAGSGLSHAAADRRVFSSHPVFRNEIPVPRLAQPG